MNDDDNGIYTAGGDLFIVPKMNAFLKKFDALAVRITLTEILVLQLTEEGSPVWVPITDVEFVSIERAGRAN